MKYLKAQNILPEEVIELIQKYVDGEFIYIPRKNGRKRLWGENSGARDSLKERNARIHEKYVDGVSVTELMNEYFLSEQSIRRIIGQEKKRLSKSLHNHL